MNEVIIPFLEKYGKESEAQTPNAKALELLREMKVIAGYASTLDKASFNHELIIPLQELYLERPDWRPSIMDLAVIIEGTVEKELMEESAKSWYGKTLDRSLWAGGLYVTAHTLGTATSKTRLGRKLWELGKRKVGEMLRKRGVKEGSVRGLVAPGKGKIVKGSRGAPKVSRKAFDRWSSFSLGLGASTGVGLIWGGAEGVYHEMSMARFSPRKALTAANRYLVFQHSFLACRVLAKARTLAQDEKEWERKGLGLPEDRLGQRQKTLTEIKDLLNEIEEELNIISPLEPELGGGLEISWQDWGEGPEESPLESFWEDDGEAEVCQLKEEEIALAIPPVLWQVGEAKKILTPLFDRYLPVNDEVEGESYSHIDIGLK
ncbi:MAG: hypothetical protein OXB88_07140 [Bacteriovoracales bacterium]|nr:hypothetical protein [Bacteriovoracales bacterium]